MINIAQVFDFLDPNLLMNHGKIKQNNNFHLFGN